MRGEGQLVGIGGAAGLLGRSGLVGPIEIVIIDGGRWQHPVRRAQLLEETTVQPGPLRRLVREHAVGEEIEREQRQAHQEAGKDDPRLVSHRASAENMAKSLRDRNQAAACGSVCDDVPCVLRRARHRIGLRYAALSPSDPTLAGGRARMYHPMGLGGGRKMVPEAEAVPGPEARPPRLRPANDGEQPWTRSGRHGDARGLVSPGAWPDESPGERDGRYSATATRGAIPHKPRPVTMLPGSRIRFVEEWWFFC
jgi:hypothetical protein